jgi:hypothetical protein
VASDNYRYRGAIAGEVKRDLLRWVRSKVMRLRGEFS